MYSPRFARALLCVAAAASAAALASAAAAEVDYGLYTLVLNSGILKCEFNKSLELDVSLLKVFMYDRQNDRNTSYYLNTSASEILAQPDFDPKRPMLLYIPGYTNTPTSPNSMVLLENTKNLTNYYIYIIDHSNYTYRDGLDYVGSYERSVKFYYAIGRQTAQFLFELTEGGVDLESILVLGHSLGAQIASATGECFLSKAGTLLPVICGADPAGPCFSTADEEFQLRSENAQYVYTIHCDKGQLGTINDFGDANFNANGGEEQPGCRTLPVQGPFLDSQTASCSHNGCMAIATLPALLTNLWSALKCDSESNYKSGNCAGNENVHAGFFVDRNANGTYYFDTTGYLSFNSTF